ncbi:MAG: type IV pilus assembly protein PilM [Planctomycetaceae bacterium]|nr:type IV pilus assembly protein PilM [Planctomycetaceae bacterium]
MAEARSAWGIDIGQAGLKAIRIRLGEDGEKVRATAFDYIPHPKILSQPDAIPEELIKQSVETFLSRNKIGNDLVGISVPGQTSLAKFIKLPPVQPNRIAEIVRYEAKQQIPFDLDDVVWDYQPIGGGGEESGFVLDAEVGLFAMKRDLIYQAMRPLTDRKVEIELVQVAPLTLYNFLSFDVLGHRISEGTDPPAREEYYIMLDMGADNTTLLVSNGRSIWIRNVPIGGNHFTRALTREMKLTFAKAEHLKCNATKAPDPKAVFQAMRPVFNDYVTEIQRSIGYFGSVNRSAKIRRVIGVGNGFKMAGLQKFLQQNLQTEVVRLDEFRGVTGDGVLSDPLFIENIMAFAVPYGLALQTLKQTRIHTTLLPPEIVVDRKIRQKKPWAVGIAAGLLVAMGISTFASARVLNSLSEEKFKPGHDAVADLQSTVSGNQSSYDAQKATHEANKAAIEELTAPLKKRELWMELLKAINVCLPQDVGNELDISDITLQKQLRIESFVQKKVENVSAWHEALVGANKAEDFHADDQEAAPDGLGYIITLKGHHYYNNPDLDYEKVGLNFVEDTLMHNLRQWTIDDGTGNAVPVGQLGISHPIVVTHSNEDVIDPSTIKRTAAGAGGMYGMDSPYGGGGSYETPAYGNDSGGAYSPPGIGYEGSPMGPMGPGGGGPAPRGLTPVDKIEVEGEQETKIVKRTNFVLQFAWIPVAQADRQDSPPGTEGAEGEAPAETTE